MGFFEAAGFAMPPHPVAAGNANYFPITVLKTKDIARQAISFGQHHGEVLQALARKLAKIMIRGRNDDVEETIAYSIREIARNIIEHSQSDEFSVCGQYYPTKGVVEIALMDCGIGIRRGLLANPHIKVTSDYEAITKALVPGISGKHFKGMENQRKTEWSNSGFGLFMTSQICRRGGQFVIGSGADAVVIIGNEKSRVPFGFEGTFIGMELNVRNLPKLIGLLENLRKKGERVAKLIKVEADIEASYASKFIMED